MEEKGIVDYIILVHAARLDLRNQVLEHINNGYVPTGGVSIFIINHSNNTKEYAQAMIKYSK